jgi:hypothetical protein
MKVILLSVLLGFSSIAFSQNGYNFIYNKNDSLIWRTQLGSITLSLISGKGRINHLFVNHVKADSTEVAYCNILQSPDNNKYIILVRSGDNGFDLFKVKSSGKISFLMNTRTEYNFLIKDELIGIDQNSYDTPQNKEKTEELTGAQAVSGGLKDEWQLRKLIVAYNIEANIKRVLLNLNKRDDISFFAESPFSGLCATTNFFSRESPVSGTRAQA